MDIPTRPGDALSQPTRARVFEILEGLRGPATTDELAAKLDLHPNGVRIHLERLLEAGLVERRSERLPRGRPRDTWTISSDAQPGGDPPTGYAELARWLVRSLVQNGVRVADMETTGQLIGEQLRAPGVDHATGEQALFNTFVSLGFQPERRPATGQRLSYRLRNCPYREAVHERQPLVCALHRGLTVGLLGSIDPDSTLTGFEPKDPDSAGCLIRIRGPIADATPDAH